MRSSFFLVCFFKPDSFFFQELSNSADRYTKSQANNRKKNPYVERKHTILLSGVSVSMQTGTGILYQQHEGKQCQCLKTTDHNSGN